jgi:DNA polymerase
MKRPNMKLPAIELGIAAMKADCEDLVFPNVMSLTANTARSCIVAPPGRKLVVADLSNIEGRMLAFLAGERWKLKAFADFDAGVGHDLYKVAYARSFNVDAATVGDTSDERQIGKVQELALGYEGGVGAFIAFAMVYNIDLADMARAVLGTLPGDVRAEAEGMWTWACKKNRTLGLHHDVYVACEALKRMWRAAHRQTVMLWSELAESVRLAIRNPGTPFTAGNHLKVQRDGVWLRIRLPSGRCLCYVKPECGEGDKGQISYMGVNQYTRQWSRIHTHGGKLAENVTQAASRDVLAYSMPTIERAGYDLVLTVHDEILTETPDEDSYTPAELSRMMTTLPPWAQGLPLAAKGFEAARYRKD